MRSKERFEHACCLGSILRENREAKGLTQEDLAMEMGVTREAISMVESGKRCSLEMVWNLSQALGLRLSDVIVMVEAKVK